MEVMETVMIYTEKKYTLLVENWKLVTKGKK